MRNLHKLFYSDYFSDVNFELDGNTVKARNRPPNDELLQSKLHSVPNCICDRDDSLLLEILYPGLVTGVGITHEVGIKGEFKLGVHFDYTYGMPVIYGSSVKGVLRSACSDSEYIHSILGENIDSELLIYDIFEGKTCINPDETNKKKREYKNRSIYQRDIFFDAVIKAPDSRGKILECDSITPHGNDPLKDPIPITFLKIASGCTMEFRFKLVDSIIKKENKKTLFENILKDFGIGAKTNVGYGQLVEVPDKK